METMKSENSSSPKIYGDDENSDVTEEIQSEVKGEVLVKHGEVDEVKQVKKGDDEVYQRENRLTSIIDQLRCQNKLKGKLSYYLFILILHAVLRYLSNDTKASIFTKLTLSLTCFL